jgi:hypothetical protein
LATSSPFSLKPSSLRGERLARHTSPTTAFVLGVDHRPWAIAQHGVANLGLAAKADRHRNAGR